LRVGACIFDRRNGGEVVGNSNMSISSKASLEIAFLSASMLDIPSVGSPNGMAVMLIGKPRLRIVSTAFTKPSEISSEQKGNIKINLMQNMLFHKLYLCKKLNMNDVLTYDSSFPCCFESFCSTRCRPGTTWEATKT
jgi:hypothetical protein